MKPTTPKRSRITKAVHAGATELFALGIIDARRMREYDFLCADPVPGAVDVPCQVVQTMDRPGAQLVPDTSVGGGFPVGTGGEIQLTYEQLTALVDAAVKQITQ